MEGELKVETETAGWRGAKRPPISLPCPFPFPHFSLGVFHHRHPTGQEYRSEGRDWRKREPGNDLGSRLNRESHCNVINMKCTFFL